MVGFKNLATATVFAAPEPELATPDAGKRGLSSTKYLSGDFKLASIYLKPDKVLP